MACALPPLRRGRKGPRGLAHPPRPSSPHLQPPSGQPGSSGSLSFLNVEINFLQMTRRLSALRPSFLPFLKIHSVSFHPQGNTCVPLFLGALVAGRAPTGLPGRWQGSPLPGLSLPISTVRQARRSPPPPASPSGSLLLPAGPGGRGGGQRLDSRLRAGCGALAEPAHLAATRAPAAGDRPVGRGPTDGLRDCSPRQPVSPSALRPGRAPAPDALGRRSGSPPRAR